MITWCAPGNLTCCTGNKSPPWLLWSQVSLDLVGGLLWVVAMGLPFFPCSKCRKICKSTQGLCQQSSIHHQPGQLRNPVQGFYLPEIRSFLSIFLTLNSFFPRTLILLTHVLTLTMISPHVFFPLFHFTFTIHTKYKPLRTSAKSIQTINQRQELSTCEALRQTPSPIRSRIARLRQSTASTPTPPQTHDETLYHEESSPKGLPTLTIPHDGMKRRQVAESESVLDSPTLGRHLEVQTTAPNWGNRWPSLFASSQPYSRWSHGTTSHPLTTLR